MKLVKTFSLAAVAAIAAMAFIGTSSTLASGAVLLCKLPELECSDPWPSGTTITEHAIDPKLLIPGLGTILCEKSLLEVTILNQLATLIIEHILSLTFEGNCHLGQTACTVTVKENGSWSVTHGSSPLQWIATLVQLPLGEAQMNTLINAKCGAIVNCTYTGGEEGETIITNSGTGERTRVAEKSPMLRSTGLCGTKMELDVTYDALGTGLFNES